MTAESLLLAGLDLLEKRSSPFTTGALARNAGGKKVPPTSPWAIQWDAYGAVMKTAGRPRIPDDGPLADAIDLLDRAAIEAGYTGAPRRCDTEGRTGALQTFKRALVLLETEGSTT